MRLTGRQWAIYNTKVYDLSDYLYTVKYFSTSSGTDLPNYAFLDDDLSALFSTQSGQDITKAMNQVLTSMSSGNATSQMDCLNNAFYVGELDFRRSPRCLVQNYLLLAFSIILITTIASKCVSYSTRVESFVPHNDASQSSRPSSSAPNANQNSSTSSSSVKFHATPRAKSP